MTATDATDATTPPPAAPADLRARQLDAIDESGWGVPFRFFQPRNAVFWVYLWALAVGVLHTVDFFRDDVGNFGGALAGGGIAFAVYGGLWLAFLGGTNRYTPESPKLLATAFAWGFFVATAALALTINGAVLGLYAKTFGQSWTADWGAGLTAPFTEEGAKALGFVVILGLAPKLVRSAYDAFVVGAFIGLGFQIWENVLYVYQGAESHFGTGQPGSAIQVIVLRSVVGIASHALFSAIFCTGLFWILGWGAEPRRVVRGLVTMAFALVAHGVWDSAAALGTTIFGNDAGPIVFMAIVLVIEIAAVLSVAKLASSSERGWMHDLLAPEVTAGVLTAAEVDALAGSRRKQRKYVKSIHGHHDRKVARHVVEAGHDLAEAIARSHGEETPQVGFARTEVLRVRAGVPA